MAKRRTISYRDTARLAVTGGAIALATTAARLFMRDELDSVAWLAPTLGTLGVGTWFLAMAAGLLALSTPYRRMAVAGLVLCGITLIGLIVIMASDPGIAPAP